MKRRCIFLLAIVFASSFVIAETHSPVSGYDASALPAPIQTLIADQTITVYVTNGSSSWEDISGETARSFTLTTTSNGTIKAVTDNASQNATFEVKLAIAVLRNATAKEEPQQALIKAYRNGAVDYRGVGTVNSMITGTTKAVSGATMYAYTGVATAVGWFI